MYKGPGETRAFCEAFRPPEGAEAVICPPYVSPKAALESDHAVFAQNGHWADEGAFSGEISAPMLLERGVQGSIVGHSERRQHFGETDDTVRMRTGNAVSLADTPTFDRLWAEYPHTTLEASGKAVGLPPGQMGNSEVGHLTIGSGRVLDQDLQRINRAIEDGSFFENPALKAAFAKGGDVHLLGLVSHGGAHSHIDHLKALLRFAPERTWIHAITHGRHASPHGAEHDLAELPAERIATVAGRYYAMDRDKRWERTERALDAITAVAGPSAADALAAVQASYANDITDEFV